MLNFGSHGGTYHLWRLFFLFFFLFFFFFFFIFFFFPSLINQIVEEKNKSEESKMPPLPNQSTIKPLSAMIGGKTPPPEIVHNLTDLLYSFISFNCFSFFK